MKPDQKNPSSGESLDTIYNGKVKLYQKKKGYRFSIDAVLLAEFAHKFSGKKMLDIGTGCGVVPLMVAYKNKSVNITGVEIQDSLYDLAQRNVKLNRLSKRIKIIQHDARHVDKIFEPGSFDIVTANPPYVKTNSGRINPDEEKAIARHEITMSLDELIKSAKYLLTPTGRFIMIYPAKRTVDILGHLRAANIEPKMIQMIHSKRDGEAKLIIVKASKRAKKGGLTVLPPLVIYKSNNIYTDEVGTILNGG